MAVAASRLSNDQYIDKHWFDLINNIIVCNTLNTYILFTF